MRHTIALRCGTLTLNVEEAELPLDELCAFATRRNRKRSFLFVSKVLGKHIPVRPSKMRDMHRRLARKIVDVLGPVVVIALAETATALGQGVFEELLEMTGREDVLFLHSTRYHLDRPLALTFDESHSHAADHRLYQPTDPEDARLFASAKSLVLVDDEISTGRTLVELARAYQTINRQLDEVHLVCLTNWMGPAQQRKVTAEMGVRVVMHSLLRGEFQFERDSAFDPGVVPDVIGKGDMKDAILPAAGGRFGTRRRSSLNPVQARIERGARVLVLGTGEFSYLPYRLALRLEESGIDVHYQSTTRSPILPGEAIASVLEFVDNYHDDIPNYVYNVIDRHYDTVVIGYETSPLPASHRLGERLGGQALFMGQKCGVPRSS
jgi:hypothetical protein